MDKHELDALEVALKDATSGRWAMFHHGDGVYELMPAMRGGSVATGLSDVADSSAQVACSQFDRGCKEDK